MRLNMRLESDDIGGVVMRASRGVDQNQVPYHPAAYHPAAYHPVSVAYHPLLLPTSSSFFYLLIYQRSHVDIESLSP